MQQSNAPDWLALPEETTVAIFEHLKEPFHVGTFESVCLTCKDWNRIMNDEKLWSVPMEFQYNGLQRSRQQPTKKYLWAKRRIVTELHTKYAFYFFSVGTTRYYVVPRSERDDYGQQRHGEFLYRQDKEEPEIMNFTANYWSARQKRKPYTFVRKISGEIYRANSNIFCEIDGTVHNVHTHPLWMPYPTFSSPLGTDFVVLYRK